MKERERETVTLCKYPESIGALFVFSILFLFRLICFVSVETHQRLNVQLFVTQKGETGLQLDTRSVPHTFADSCLHAIKNANSVRSASLLVTPHPKCLTLSFLRLNYSSNVHFLISVVFLTSVDCQRWNNGSKQPIGRKNWRGSIYPEEGNGKQSQPEANASASKSNLIFFHV